MLLILVVFSLAGISILPVRHAIFWVFGYTAETSLYLKGITWLILVFPAYQLFLLIFGFLLGQFDFFWEKEKRMIRWIWHQVNRE
jgi:hypothetical protein